MKIELKGLMRRPASFLNDRLGVGKKETDQTLREDLLTLAGGRRGAVEEYYQSRTENMLWMGLGGILLAAVLIINGLMKDPSVREGRILRPDYGSDPKETILEASAEGSKETGTVNLEISQRRYTRAEKEKLLNAAIAELEQGYLGENADPGEVRSDLRLPETLQGGAVKVQYLMMPYGIISEQGKIMSQPPDEGAMVEIRADLECQGTAKSREMSVHIFPAILSEDEQFWKEVGTAAEEAESSRGEEEYMTLPTTVAGQRILWSYPRDHSFWFFAFLCAMMPFFWLVRADQQVREQAGKRQDELRADYPDLVWKMTLLMGAGLTISGAFSKIAGEYMKQRQNGGDAVKSRYAYEEMVYSCREMKSGVPEGKAYENFGRRCQVACYIRRGSLLSQNLKKGSRGLASTLEKEAVSSLEMRRNEARKKGEKAAARLLLPMVLMLGVVMAVLTVPAFLSM